MNRKYCLAFLLSLLTPLLIACQRTGHECRPAANDEVVGNAGCLILQQDKLLMVQQRSNGHWALPGGTAAAGETASCTAERETLEETGLDVTAQFRILTLDNGFHLYRCYVNGDSPVGPIDAMEIVRWDWLDIKQRKQLPWRFEEQRGLIDGLVREQQQRDLRSVE